MKNAGFNFVCSALCKHFCLLNFVRIKNFLNSAQFQLNEQDDRLSAWSDQAGQTLGFSQALSQSLLFLSTEGTVARTKKKNHANHIHVSFFNFVLPNPQSLKCPHQESSVRHLQMCNATQPEPNHSFLRHLQPFTYIHILPCVQLGHRDVMQNKALFWPGGKRPRDWKCLTLHGTKGKGR